MHYKKIVAVALFLPVLFIAYFSHIHTLQFVQPTLNEQHVATIDNTHITKLQNVTYTSLQDNSRGTMTLPSTRKESGAVQFTWHLALPKEQELYSLQLIGLEQPFTFLLNGELIEERKSLGIGKTLHFFAPERTVQIDLIVTPTNGRLGFLQTPTIAPMPKMELFVFKQFASTLIILCSCLFISIYSFVIYAQKRFLFQLQMSLYFLFVSCSFFLSNNGLAYLWTSLPNIFSFQLKTAVGILAIIPLSSFIADAYERPLSKKTLFALVTLVLIAVSSLFIVPAELSSLLDLILWIIIISILFIHTAMLFYSFYQSKQLQLKQVALVQAFFYLAIYLSLRVYYNMHGTNLQTTLWLIVFVLNIFVYLVLHQRNITHELNVSKKEAMQSKLSFFNAQIKPHFIYNALSNIMALCYTDNMKAAHLLGKFSTYLRIIFENNNSNDMITLQKELSLIEAYVEIEQARFPNKITYACDVDDSLLSLLIPPLVIQPFVENAVRHGLFNQMIAGTVTVTITKQDAVLIVTIHDTGVGIEPDVLHNIQRGTHANQGIGVMNVKQRLKLMPNSAVLIESTVDVGTRVELHIPL